MQVKTIRVGNTVFPYSANIWIVQDSSCPSPTLFARLPHQDLARRWEVGFPNFPLGSCIVLFITLAAGLTRGDCIRVIGSFNSQVVTRNP